MKLLGLVVRVCLIPIHIFFSKRKAVDREKKKNKLYTGSQGASSGCHCMLLKPGHTLSVSPTGGDMSLKTPAPLDEVNIPLQLQCGASTSPLRQANTALSLA